MTHANRTQRDHRANVASVHSAVCDTNVLLPFRTSPLFLKRANSIESKNHKQNLHSNLYVQTIKKYLQASVWNGKSNYR